MNLIMQPSLTNTLVYGVGTKTIVLRINWRIHSYIILYRNMNASYCAVLCLCIYVCCMYLYCVLCTLAWKNVNGFAECQSLNNKLNQIKSNQISLRKRQYNR